jgi:rod shape-determining protein MreD
MYRSVKLFLLTALALFLQVTVFPYYLLDAFKPNLIIILVVYLALRERNSLYGAAIAYFLGLLQDVFSGIYLGLSGFSLLLIFLVLRKTSNQLYTDSTHLMVVVVFLSTGCNGLLNLLLMLLFAPSAGIYETLLSNLLPQALFNALIASLLFGVPILSFKKDGR